MDFADFPALYALAVAATCAVATYATKKGW